MRSVSPIREPLSATIFPQTPEQLQSKWSPNTASPESTFTHRSTMPVQSKFSPVSTISPQSKRSGRSVAVPESKFSAHSTPQSNYSPQSTFAPVPRYTGFIDNRRPRPSSLADSLTTVNTKNTTATTRKPVPHRVASSTAASIMTNATAKALPPPPMDLDPKDRIANLEARMGDLYVQKSNITRIIADLKETKPQNPLLSDIAKRREDERRLQELEEQLHNIVSEEHETGVSLSRAWRKRDEENPEFSSSVLWIHRVTS
ncbi:hypothetical protein EJ05DRAFT_250209 [Pseudovirgaria hyperparasitica]|uniref:Uncharacterized protein n=1 Tax=Pseudovirgaria hyperparasitica TaxID=470096 RepID=A0A6A6WEQ0_9PEZI|nr:uncharacterized protein EJ05DRAFT_250209 [Pseudovirgaria hyperparasitica]KAF2761015.1 hypothetical protein EJ05DRAFT_250209 [Pseudovirgaria hyperparasitica]